MKIKQVASNMVEYFSDNGAIVLYSYETPVAAILPNGVIIKDETKYSATTTKHINKWFNHMYMFTPCAMYSAFNVKSLPHDSFILSITNPIGDIKS